MQKRGQSQIPDCHSRLERFLESAVQNKTFKKEELEADYLVARTGNALSLKCITYVRKMSLLFAYECLQEDAQ